MIMQEIDIIDAPLSDATQGAAFGITVGLAILGLILVC